MRIKVVTSINVRSSPFTSPSVATHHAFHERCDASLEKTSPSATPSLAPDQLSSMDRFIDSQRIPHGSRLSGWLHGSSVRGKDGKKPPVQTRKPKTSHTSTYCFAAAEREHQHHAAGIRSYSSTRGVIDPVHSPAYAPRQLTYGSDPRHEAYLQRLRVELGSVPREHSSKRYHRQRPKRSPAKNERFCFPQIKDLKMRQKAIGCLVFGTLLTIVLTTYLALAISNSLRGATFHGIFIFFILLLTILFSHYLIRLCMLSFEPRTRFPRKCQPPLRAAADEEAGFAQPARPIPVVLARDAEREPRIGRVEHEGDDEAMDNALPLPPPAYGLWRSSVRADPNLIHWQAVGPDANVQREAREMIFAGTGHSPPSYTSDDRAAEGVFDGRVEGVLEPELAAAPLPSVAERRAAGMAVSRGGTVRMARWC